jgi:manganese transport protein
VPSGDSGSRRRKLAATLGGLGPAVVAAIAYVDPGNVATNIAAGAGEGYLLVWVVVLANLVAVLVQNLSAKLGLATGQSLARLCRDRFTKPVSRMLWVQAEAVAMATDVAEILGGALALNLLFGLPLVQGALVTAVAAFGLLKLQSRGATRFEVVVGGLFAVILLGFLVNVVTARPDAGDVAAGMVPRFSGPDSITLATGILGATVMPHVIYLHSAMTAREHHRQGVIQRLRQHRRAIAVALGAAGLVNLSMLVFASALFSGSAAPVDSIEGAYEAMSSSGGHWSALLLAVALLASGLASTGVGTYAGQIVMDGFLRRRLPLLTRRLLSVVPAVVLLAFGVNATAALVVSQVVLSFGVPFALIPLLMFTRRRDVMGDLVNRTRTTVLAGICSALIIALNVLLLVRLVRS